MTERASARELVWAALGVAGVAGAWLGLSISTGAFGIPRDDDWSYIQVVLNWAQTGALEFNGWIRMLFVGHGVLGRVLVALPLDDIMALQLGVWLLAVVAGFLTYAVLRTISAPPVSLVGTAAFILGPSFGIDAVTFMTDMPMIALQLTCLLLGIAAIRSRGHTTWWFAGACLAGLAAVTVREYAIVTLVLVAVVVMATQTVRHRSAISPAVLSLVTLAVIAALLSWRSGVANGNYDPTSFPPFSDQGADDRIRTLARAALTLALLCAPAIGLISVPHLVRQAWGSARVTLVVTVLCTLAVTAVTGLTLLGNQIHPFGDTWMVVGEGARQWPLNAFRLLVILSILLLGCFLLLTGLLLRSQAVRRHQLMSCGRRYLETRPEAIMVLSFGPLLILTNALATVILGAPFLDRYLAAAVPFITASLVLVALREQVAVGRFRRITVPVVLMLFALGSVNVVAFAAAVDGSKWSFATTVQGTGIPAQNINGGVEWFSFHQGLDGGDPDPDSTRPWWTSRFPRTPVCATVVMTGTQAASGGYGEILLQQEFRAPLGQHFWLSAVRGPDTCP